MSVPEWPGSGENPLPGLKAATLLLSPQMASRGGSLWFRHLLLRVLIPSWRLHHYGFI